MSANVVELGDESFEQEVEKSGGLVLIDFWAAWCAPCRIVAPTIERLAQRYTGRVRFAKVNVDEAPATAEAYQIASIPTLLIFKDGEPVTGVAGAVPESFLAEMIDKVLAGSDSLAAKEA